ncbi:MAG: RNA polymerase sigma factor WhiG [Spirochaetaceae bacterium]|jgi:RNA polymerase sigma factor for flagellar operon FliA|nr:RNA polymerase sigma factor WhiG [Spirochaetaceae bacterium]
MGNSLPQDKTEDELWLEFQKTKDPKIRDMFIKQYAPLVKYVAGKVALGMPKNVEFDDLVSCGTFGLIDAIERYDPERDIKFKTYAVTRIRGSIFDELRAADWVPRSVRQKIREVEEAAGTLEAQYGRPATEKEVAEYLKMDEAEFLKTMMKISSTSVLSLNDVWFSGDENDKVSIGDSIEAPSSLNPDVIVEREEIRRIVIDVINNLPDKEKKIMVLYHYEDLTLKEIGQVLDITESRVSQLHSKAIDRILQKLTNVRKGII